MLTLICGIPNAGKTTYSNKHYPAALHNDALVRNGQNVVEIIRDAAGDICIEGVFSSPMHRRPIADAYAGRKVCIWLDTSLEDCLRRENRNRSERLLKMYHRCFQPPSYDEGWDEIIIEKGEI